MFSATTTSAGLSTRHEARTALPADTALIRWLRVVVWGAALVPLLAFAAAAAWGYRSAYVDAHGDALKATHVATAHAQGVFKVASDAMARARTLTSLPDADIRAREAELHERFKDLALGLPAGASLGVIGAQGKMLVTGARYPLDPAVSYTDRDFFQRLSSEPGSTMDVSEVLVDRQSGQSTFRIVVARRSATGAFNGVILVSLPPQHFHDFYRSLAPERSLNSFTLLRDDGALLTRWPTLTQPTPRISAASPLLPKLRAGETSGVLDINSTFDGERRLISFQRVPELPVYVLAGLSQDAILANWYRYLTLLAAILLPTTVILAWVAWLALQRVQRQETLRRDLDDEKHMRAQAELALLQGQKLEALGHLTGGVAHDFNNLLGIVSNSVYVLQRSLPKGTNSAPLEAIGRATTSGIKLTRQLLSFARKQALKPELLRLQDWLPAAGDLLRTTLGSQIALAVDVDARTAPVWVDPSELEIALINLAVNAKHAMPGGGALQLLAGNAAEPLEGRPAPAVAIRVIDTGVGIAPGVIGKVFEPFFTTKPAGSGSGLGLSQVYGLCTQSGGGATVESVEGQGTTVSLFFPAQADHATPAQPAGPLEASWLHARVLMVEDNDDLAATQAAWLRTAGLTVEHVSRCDLALEILERDSGRFDAVLSDVVTPGTIDGVDMALRLRKTCPGLPVLLMSGYNERVKEAREAGVELLEKPVAPESLLGRLTQLLAVRADVRSVA